jgi:DNA-binding HxlR family transcriptional regulator
MATKTFKTPKKTRADKAAKHSVRKTSSGPARQLARPPLRRSVCPVSCGLDIFGDRWSLLIVRDLMLGRSRFKELAASPEGIATNLLSERLVRLTGSGIIRQMPSPDGTRHRAYQLTSKGEALRPVVEMIRDWALHWEPGTAARRNTRS